jgi:hypothetical protein
MYYYLDPIFPLALSKETSVIPRIADWEWLTALRTASTTKKLLKSQFFNRIVSTGRIIIFDGPQTARGRVFEIPAFSHFIILSTNTT